jgi:hypothetical protein
MDRRTGLILDGSCRWEAAAADKNGPQSIGEIVAELMARYQLLASDEGTSHARPAQGDVSKSFPPRAAIMMSTSPIPIAPVAAQ